MVFIIRFPIMSKSTTVDYHSAIETKCRLATRKAKLEDLLTCPL